MEFEIKSNQTKSMQNDTSCDHGPGNFLNFCCFFFFFFVWQMLCVLYYYYYYYFVRRSRFERKRSNLVSWKEVKRNKGAGSVCVCVEWNCVWRGFFRNFFFCDHFFFKVAWWIFFFFFFIIRYLWMCHCWPDLGSKFCRGLQMNS